MTFISSALRFKFGENWLAFLSVVDEERINGATARLAELIRDLKGKSFLDVGCGSGIQSLAALRLGASHVMSFDYDPQSVECCREMKRRFAPQSNWQIEQGSALDETYLRSLGGFDVVYAWGVLHHTGNLWKALELVATLSKQELAVAIYNDQGLPSQFWRSFKRAYNRSGRFGRRLLETYAFVWLMGKGFLIHPRRSAAMWREYSKQRGMSPWHDIVDWAGGYPFEVARPEDVISFFESRKWNLDRLIRHHKRACNEFVFRPSPFFKSDDAISFNRLTLNSSKQT